MTSPMTSPPLSDAAIAQQLRHTVKSIFNSGLLEELTVKRVRAAAENSLGLGDGYLKQAAWKDRSKALIEEAVVRARDA